MFLGRHTCLPWLFESDALSAVPLLSSRAAPRDVIVVGDRRRVARVLRHLDDAMDLSAFSGENIGELAAGRVAVGVGTTGSLPVLVVETQMGGPAVEIIVREILDESFHPDGPRSIIRVGTCGTLEVEGKVPPLCIGSHATGWSNTIEQTERGVLAGWEDGSDPPVLECTPEVIKAMQAAAAEIAPGVFAATGGAFSKDSLYSEQDTEFAAILRRLGCVATEMEISTIGPLAQRLGVAWGCVLASGGVVPDGPWLPPDEIARNEDRAIEVALSAIRRL